MVMIVINVTTIIIITIITINISTTTIITIVTINITTITVSSASLTRPTNQGLPCYVAKYLNISSYAPRAIIRYFEKGSIRYFKSTSGISYLGVTNVGMKSLKLHQGVLC